MNNLVLEQFINDLNDEQRKAATLSAKSSLILSTAGSGKTSTLTARIAYLVSELKVDPENILAVTFTNKAAGEMKNRLQKFAIDKLPTWIGTFHGICNKILRSYANKVGLKNDFYIIDSSEQESLIKKLVKTQFSKDLDIPNIIFQINKWQENGQRAKDIQQKTIVKDIFMEYEKLCIQNNCIDFAQLISRVYEILTSHPQIATYYHNKFKYILIDEFQDTNDLQYKWLKKISQAVRVVDDLTGEQELHQNVVFAVGDDDQCLYSWRGAKVQNMSDFITDFKPEIIKLEKNYRSDGFILQGANAVIHNNKIRQAKQLVSTRESVEKIRYFRAENDLSEAGFIAEKIMEYRRLGMKFSQIAVLYRTNAQSRSIEKVFTSFNIPFLVYGGFKFFDRAEVKNAMAYLRLSLNPHDNLAFARVYNFPARGIGATSFEKLSVISQQKGISLFESISYLDNKTQEKFLSFKEEVERLSQLVGVAHGLVKQMTVCVVNSGLEAFYQQDKKDGQQKLENLYELISAAQVFERENLNNKNITIDFLALSSLEADPQTNKKDPLKDAVKIMTVHTSKGLEWEIVFVSGVEEGLIPHMSSMQEEELLAEERRLMYVAMTRAKKILYLTRAEERLFMGNTVVTNPSRFLYEIPKDIITSKF